MSLDPVAVHLYRRCTLSDDLMVRVAAELQACGRSELALHLLVLIAQPGAAQPVSVGEVEAMCRALSRAGRAELVPELHAAIVAATGD